MAAEKFGKASDPSRLKIMLVLAQQDRNVTELCGDLGSQSQPAVSHHLAILASHTWSMPAARANTSITR